MSDYRPDIEAVTYFRSALERDIEWMEAAAERLSGDVRKGYQKALNLLRYRTLGDESGCVITTFDRRGPKLLDALNENSGAADDGPAATPPNTQERRLHYEPQTQRHQPGHR